MIQQPLPNLAKQFATTQKIQQQELEVRLKQQEELNNRYGRDSQNAVAGDEGEDAAVRANAHLPTRLCQMEILLATTPLADPAQFLSKPTTTIPAGAMTFRSKATPSPVF